MAFHGTQVSLGTWTEQLIDIHADHPSVGMGAHARKKVNFQTIGDIKCKKNRNRREVGEHKLTAGP